MSKKLKLSPWHDGSVKPVHVGPYEGYDYYTGCIYFSWYDGENFNGWWGSIEEAVRMKNFGPMSKITKWRGVLK